jgi:hypothetical protein
VFSFETSLPGKTLPDYAGKIFAKLLINGPTANPPGIVWNPA